MAKPKNTTPPFAWLGRYWVPVGIGIVTATAAAFRFFQLASLPPGLDEQSARIGLQAADLGSKHWIPSLDAANGYSALWVWLQSISVHLFGHSAIALRIWPAILGTLAVFVLWLWLRDWFGIRVAWVGAVIMAVSPWAVTLSRSGSEAVLYPLLVPLTLWTGTLVWRHATKLNSLAFGGVIALNLLSGPIGWLLVLTLGVLAVIRATRRHEFGALLTRSRALSLAGIAIGAGTSAYIIATSLGAIKDMPSAMGYVTSLGAFGQNLVKVLLMFNVHGDENYRHNLSGEPMLNAFVGLMMIAGLLVCISRLHKVKYRLLLILVIVMLLPAIKSTLGAPNADLAAGAMPLIFGLVGVGTGYMLELWYATFPINSAARATGQAAIILLLALSLVQGFTQYFQAWGGSTAVYLAQNEGVADMADSLKNAKADGEQFVVLPADQAPVVHYLANGHKARIMTPSELAALPIAPGVRHFYIIASARDESVKVLKAKFAGGVLRPHISDFNQIENYYTYDVSK